MTGPLPQSDSRHGNQDQDQRCSQSPSGRMEPFHRAPAGFSPPHRPMGTPGAAWPACPDGAPELLGLCSALFSSSTIFKRKTAGFLPSSFPPQGGGCQPEGPEPYRPKGKQKAQPNTALLRQPRVPSWVLPAGSHRTGGKGKYERSRGEGAHPASLCHAQPSGLALI